MCIYVFIIVINCYKAKEKGIGYIMESTCCIPGLKLRTDNARFALLTIGLLIYMIGGAMVFMLLERDHELKDRLHYRNVYDEFVSQNGGVNRSQLRFLLDAHARAATFGVLPEQRQRWDFSGSFYFVGTVVSTIGFGRTTPKTSGGRVVLMLYGFIGCAGGFLFFNLFLERMVTVLAAALRRLHERDMHRRRLAVSSNTASVAAGLGIAVSLNPASQPEAPIRVTVTLPPNTYTDNGQAHPQTENHYESRVETEQPMSSNQSESWIGRSSHHQHTNHAHHTTNHASHNNNNNHVQHQSHHHVERQQHHQQHYQQHQQQQHRFHDNEDGVPAHPESATTTTSGPAVDTSGQAAGSLTSGQDHWKPSVYAVMAILFTGAVVLACLASIMYAEIEQWSYFDSIYYCFVSFSTIGFGDYVVFERLHYRLPTLYAFMFMIFTMIGCACVYSLFNVTSIVIKQLLNWILARLECKCKTRRSALKRINKLWQKNGCHANDNGDQQTNRRNAIVPANGRLSTESRRDSSEMISVRGLVQGNRVSMAMLQKRLYETSQQPRHAPTITVTEGYHAHNHSRHAPSHSTPPTNDGDSSKATPFTESSTHHGHLSVITSASSNSSSVRRSMLNRIEGDNGGVMSGGAVRGGGGEVGGRGGADDEGDPGISSMPGQETMSWQEIKPLHQSSDNIRRDLDSTSGSHPMLLTPSQSVTAIMSSSHISTNQNYAVHQQVSLHGTGGLDDAIGPLAMLNRKLGDTEDQMT